MYHGTQFGTISLFSYQVATCIYKIAIEPFACWLAFGQSIFLNPFVWQLIPCAPVYGQ